MNLPVDPFLAWTWLLIQVSGEFFFFFLSSIGGREGRIGSLRLPDAMPTIIYRMDKQ